MIIIRAMLSHMYMLRVIGKAFPSISTHETYIIRIRTSDEKAKMYYLLRRQ